jgi:uncharacterized protein DUF87
MRRILELLRCAVHGDPRHLARQAQWSEWVGAESDLRRFAADLRLRPKALGVALGHVRFRSGRRQAVGIPRDLLLSTHVAISGASGCGKTTTTLDVLDQTLRWPKVHLVSVDPKGDMDHGLREERFPLLADRYGAEFADRVRYLRPFAGGPVAPLRLTAPEPGVSIEVQSLSLATAMAEASGLPLTPPAVQAFVKLARLAIELHEPLTVIVTWITRPEVFARVARRSADDRLRHYAKVEFPREHRGMLRALQARLESVLLLPSVRAALEAPTCVSFARALEEHHLHIDLSHPPGGEESAVRILGGPIIGRLTRAILNRLVREDSPHVVLAVDELQELLTHYEEASVGRLAALARSRKVTLLCINQQRVQLGAKLSEVLRTNCGIELLFRCHAADAEALAHVFPVRPDAERPSEERRAFVRRMVSLPRRHCLAWVKGATVPAHFIQARQVDSKKLRQVVASLPAGMRKSLGRWPADLTTQGSASPRPRPHIEPPPAARPESEADFDPGSPFPPLG